MAHNKFIIVSDDHSLVERFKSFCQQNGVEMQSYTNHEWYDKNSSQKTPLAMGQNPVEENVSNVIPFPKVGMHTGEVYTKENGKMKTINELQSIAIQNAVYEFKGNLTETARALGIGRATLYRKVKQYNIDPSLARRKKVAA